ncbi:MAG: winged helix-turn-helix transcriptional regulator, partial [Candidatus Electrothrix sp. AR3]|nr:winged helix-turn-helix transcriptional regulator [Candidatus Electrothrix sp. AR3]
VWFFFGMMKENPRFSSRELAELLSMRPDTVKEYFRRLKTKGLLLREGTSRSGHWIVLLNREDN